MNENVKDIILNEYNSLREEAIQRAGTQSTVIGWLIGLMGTFIGLNIAFVPKGMCEPIILSYLFHPNEEVITLFVFLCAGFTIGVELLWSYWIYNLYHILVIGSYIRLMEPRLKGYLNLDDRFKVLRWDKENSPELLDLKNNKRIRTICKINPVGIASLIQPLSLIILSFLGFIGILSSLIFKFNIEIIIVSIIIFLSIVFLLWIHISIVFYFSNKSIYPFTGIILKWISKLVLKN